MKLTAKPLAVLIFVILFGGIALTTALGWWQSTTTKIPAKYAEGEAAGQYNPADIRGSYKFGDISALFDIPITDLQAAFRLPANVDPAEFQVKTLETQFAGQPVEIGATSVRLFVAAYKGLPFELTDEIYLPAEAVEILKKKASLNSAMAAYLASHIVNLDQPGSLSSSEMPATQAGVTALASTPTPEPVNVTPGGTEHVKTERTITGKTTFQELLDWGVTQAAIEQVLGEPMPSPGTVIREYYSAKGQEFSSAKSDFQALVDQVK
jgi:hypothetical protein